MKLPFKYIAILVIVSLAGIFAYQAYWLTGLYHTMHSEMERDITEAMRMSDYNEMMIRVDKMKQDDINHGEVSVSAGYSDDGKSFVRSSTTISREDSLDNTTLHETFMPKGDSVYVTHPNDSTRVEVSVRKNVPLLTKEDSVLFIDQHRETDKVRWMSADSARERLRDPPERFNPRGSQCQGLRQLSPIRIECQRGTGCDFARPKQYAGTRHLLPARTAFGTGHHFRPRRTAL